MIWRNQTRHQQVGSVGVEAPYAPKGIYEAEAVHEIVHEQLVSQMVAGIHLPPHSNIADRTRTDRHELGYPPL